MQVQPKPAPSHLSREPNRQNCFCMKNSLLARTGFLFFAFFTTSFTVCAQQVRPSSNYLEHVGDIPFDPSKDDPGFVICDTQQVIQYYGTTSWYKDNKKEIAQFLTSRFAPSDTLNQTGYITIRFVINCKGETGRFRMYELDSSYHNFHFSEKISGQLLQLVKQVKGWQPAKYSNFIMDSYQHIIFRIRNGKIISISP